MSSSSEAEFEDEEEEEEEEEEYNEDNAEEEDDEEEEEEEEEEPRKRASRKEVSYNEDDDDDDDDDESSDDDLPLAQLAVKLKKKQAATNGKKKVAAKKAKASPVVKKKKSPSSASSKKSNGSSSTSSKKTYEWASAALYGSNCDKGQLIQQFLCRWWYSYTWPDPEVLKEAPPDHYDRLDGFPGVYVCTEGDDVGTILDRRDASTAPSFTNMAKKPSSELKELLLSALEAQKKQLIEHDGEGTTTEKDIDGLTKWTRKVNADKADREAKKVLQASSIKL